MAIQPIQTAHGVFRESLISLMAHTIRGVTNYFYKHGLDLDVIVKADTYNRIRLEGPELGTTSILHTRFITETTTERPRIKAHIYVHKDANKHLARLCIAHEMFHLLMELDEYITNGRKEWKTGLKSTPEIESRCNQFAWELCKAHDLFNRNAGLVARNVHFPDHTFDTPLRTDNTTHRALWPAGISLDPNKPFHEDPIVLIRSMGVWDNLEDFQGK